MNVPAMTMLTATMKLFRMPILLTLVTLMHCCGVTNRANYTCRDTACHKASCYKAETRAGVVVERITVAV